MREPRFCSVREAARILGRPEKTIYGYISQRMIPMVKIKGRDFIPLAWFNRLEAKAYENCDPVVAVNVAEVKGGRMVKRIPPEPSD